MPHSHSTLVTILLTGPTSSLPVKSISLPTWNWLQGISGLVLQPTSRLAYREAIALYNRKSQVETRKREAASLLLIAMETLAPAGWPIVLSAIPQEEEEV